MSFRAKYGWSLFVAQRYLFSKKSHNTINVITLVSMCGVAVGTMALVCVLSVLNGFETLVNGSFVAFDPDLRIESAEGRVFDSGTDAFGRIRRMSDVQAFSEVLSSNALVAFGGKQTPAEMRGVAANYAEAVGIRDLIIDGRFGLDEGAVAGVGLSSALGLGYGESIDIYVPKRQSRVNLARPDNAFYRQTVFLSGVFASGQEKSDDATLFVPIALAQELCDYTTNDVSAVEIRLKADANTDKVQRDIQQLLGDDFTVKNRYEQQADFYRILQIEKWITFLILAFILLIATCNIIGSLSMLMINKRGDIALFYALGAQNRKVQHLFLIEGWMIAIYGAVVGVLLGVVLCALQQHFGIIKMGAGYVVEQYPVDVRWGDVTAVFCTVIALGFVLAAYPASVLKKSEK